MIYRFIGLCLATNKITQVLQTSGGYIGQLRQRVMSLHNEVQMALLCRDCFSGYTSLIATMVLAKVQPKTVNIFNFIGYWLAVWGGVRLVYKLADYQMINHFQQQRIAPPRNSIDTFNLPGEIPLHLGQRVHLNKETLISNGDKQRTIKVSDVATLQAMLIKQCDCQDKRRYLLDFGDFLYEAGRGQVVPEESYA